MNSNTIAAERLQCVGPVVDWWHATDRHRQIAVRWSPAQLWIEVVGSESIVVKNDPHYEDVKRLVEALHINLENEP